MNKSDKPIIQHQQDFLDWLDVEKGVSTKSQENYARFIKKFFDWLRQTNSEGLRPHELTADHIRSFRLHLSRQMHPHKPGVSLERSTQNYYLIAVRSLLNCFADRDILSLPSEKIKLPKNKKERQVKFLTIEQLEAFFEAPDTSTLRGMRDRAILESLFSTGMRIAELVALNKEQIKIDEETKELELSIMGKNSSVRTVYFSERAIHWLYEYLIRRKDEDPALFIAFKGQKGSVGRITPRSVQKLFKKYSAVSGIPLFTTPHVMRHSFATDLLSKGVDIRTLQEFLGHRNISATQIYAHVTNKRLRDIHRRHHGGHESSD